MRSVASHDQLYAKAERQIASVQDKSADVLRTLSHFDKYALNSKKNPLHILGKAREREKAAGVRPFALSSSMTWKPKRETQRTQDNVASSSGDNSSQLPALDSRRALDTDPIITEQLHSLGIQENLEHLKEKTKELTASRGQHDYRSIIKPADHPDYRWDSDRFVPRELPDLNLEDVFLYQKVRFRHAAGDDSGFEQEMEDAVAQGRQAHAAAKAARHAARPNTASFKERQRAAGKRRELYSVVADNFAKKQQGPLGAATAAATLPLPAAAGASPSASTPAPAATQQPLRPATAPFPSTTAAPAAPPRGTVYIEDVLNGDEGNLETMASAFDDARERKAMREMAIRGEVADSVVSMLWERIHQLESEVEEWRKLYRAEAARRAMAMDIVLENEKLQKRVEEAERKSVHWRTRMRDRVEQSMRDKKYLSEAGGDRMTQDATLFRLTGLRQRINVPLVTPSIDVLRSLAEREVVEQAEHWRNKYYEEEEKSQGLEAKVKQLKSLLASEQSKAEAAAEADEATAATEGSVVTRSTSE